MTGTAAVLMLALAAAPRQDAAPAAPVSEAGHQLIFLAESRPVFLRLRISSDGRPFEASWIDSVRTMHAALDRNGDGTLTTKEADPGVVAALIRLAAGAIELPALRDLDVQPKDGKISVDELAEAIQPILGRFRLQIGASRSAARMLFSISLTATRTASSPGPSSRPSPDRSVRSTWTMMK